MVSSEIDHGGILIPAMEGGGKTSCCVWLMKKGLYLLSDEIVFYDPSSDGYLAYPRRLGLDHMFAERFSQGISVDTRMYYSPLTGKAKHLLDPRSQWPGRISNRTDLRALLMPGIWTRKESMITSDLDEEDRRKIASIIPEFILQKLPTEAILKLYMGRNAMLISRVFGDLIEDIG
jgi:hypothetical protein